MKAVEEQAQELVESFLNGNRTFVADEIVKMKKPRGAAVVAWMADLLSNDERATLAKLLENRS